MRFKNKSHPIVKETDLSGEVSIHKNLAPHSIEQSINRHPFVNKKNFKLF